NFPVGYQQNQGFQQPANARVFNQQQAWGGNNRATNPFRQAPAPNGMRTGVAPVPGPSYSGNYPYANGAAPQMNRAMAPSGASVATYQVQRGDSLSVIGHRYGVSVDTLRRLNNIHGDLIIPGQNLRLR
ncbi:MAG: LysM domain-containing protein, partial [Verrucomicrobiota bacterium]